MLSSPIIPRTLGRSISSDAHVCNAEYLLRMSPWFDYDVPELVPKTIANKAPNMVANKATIAAINIAIDKIADTMTETDIHPADISMTSPVGSPMSDDAIELIPRKLANTPSEMPVETAPETSAEMPPQLSAEVAAKMVDRMAGPWIANKMTEENYKAGRARSVIMYGDGQSTGLVLKRTSIMGNHDLIMREILAMNRVLGRPGLAQIIGWREYKDHVDIVMPYYGVDLYDLIFDQKAAEVALGADIMHRLCEISLYTIAWQLTLALHYLHAANMMHCDVKLENVFISAAGVITLGDFGHARRAGDPRMSSFVCTNGYRAPEIDIRQRTAKYGKSADMWSLGIILYELATGNPAVDPESTKHDVQLALSLLTGADVPDDIGEAYKMFAALDINTCRETITSRFEDAGVRPNATLIGIITACLHPNPAKRWDTRGVLDALSDAVGMGYIIAPTLPTFTGVDAAFLPMSILLSTGALSVGIDASEYLAKWHARDGRVPRDEIDLYACIFLAHCLRPMSVDIMNTMDRETSMYHVYKQAMKALRVLTHHVAPPPGLAPSAADIVAKKVADGQQNLSSDAISQMQNALKKLNVH